MHEDSDLSTSLTPDARRRLLRAAIRLLGPADAEDAVQDAYVRALESGPAHLAALHTAPAWLHTVLRHLAIDRLRRRQWWQDWLAGAAATAGGGLGSGPGNERGAPQGEGAHAPSAEQVAALAQDTARALRRLAARLPGMDGALVLLHEVFDATHAELAQASGKTEAGSRQQLRRALLRLRGAAAPSPAEEAQERLLQLYLHALQQRNPQVLWALLRQPAVQAAGGMRPDGTLLGGSQADAGWHAAPPQAAPRTGCGVVQSGGQLGLVLTLDGVTLCVLPLGVRAPVPAS